MPDVSVPTEKVLQRHPDRVEEAMDKMNSGNSRAVGSPPEAFDWEYRFMLSLGRLDLGDLLERLQQDENNLQEELSWSLQKHLRQLRKRYRVQLTMKHGRTRWRAPTFLDEIPPEVEDYLAEMARKQMEGALQRQPRSEEEQREHIRSVLEKLRQTSGGRSTLVASGGSPQPSPSSQTPSSPSRSSHG